MPAVTSFTMFKTQRQNIKLMDMVKSEDWNCKVQQKPRLQPFFAQELLQVRNKKPECPLTGGCESGIFKSPHEMLPFFLKLAISYFLPPTLLFKSHPPSTEKRTEICDCILPLARKRKTLDRRNPLILNHYNL